jgi:hypothetical protein
MYGGRFHYTNNMPKIWEPGQAESLLSRLEVLRPDTKAKWGKLTADGMLFHCTGGMLAAMGELELMPKISLLAAWPVRKLVIYVAPFPKNAPTAPELIPLTPLDFEEQKAAFVGSLGRFVEAGRDPDFRFTPHAAFGRLTPADWGTLTWRHVDHHWKQFGL